MAGNCNYQALKAYFRGLIFGCMSRARHHSSLLSAASIRMYRFSWVDLPSWDLRKAGQTRFLVAVEIFPRARMWLVTKILSSVFVLKNNPTNQCQHAVVPQGYSYRAHNQQILND